MPFNFFETHNLLMAVEQLTPPTTFLRDRYFPTNAASDIFATNDVLVEYKDGSKRVAPFVAPRKGGVTVLRNGYEVQRFEPPFVAPRRMLTIDDLNKRGFGEALLSQLTPEQRQRALVLKDAQELSDMISRREEAMAAEVMQTNACVMKHIADDVDVADEKHINFANGDSTWQYTPTGNWGKDYAGVLADLGAMARLLTKRGLGATELVVGADAADAILANAEIQKLLDLKNYEAGRIDPKTLPHGATHIATLNAKGRLIDVICYDEEYTEGSETKAYIDAKSVILTAPGAGRTLYGAVSQVEQSDGLFHTYTGKRVPKYLSNADGNTRSLTLSACPLLIPNNKNPFIVAKVLD
ncbi:MAG: major capsid protein [Oscillospiraceae bacterium]|nr:major capsid protein [Oscillospiraceae bacterium]